jgi:WD40 repeat protein
MSTHSRSWVNSLLDDQSVRWGRGERIVVETYLERHPLLKDDTEAVLDLIHHEVVLRQYEGERPAVEDYVGRFPWLRQSLHRQFEVHAAIDQEPLSLAGLAGPQLTPGAVPEVPGYQVLGELGRGAIGVVYLARQTRLNRLCALKMIRGGDLADPECSLRFLAEAEVVARIAHPNVLQIYQIGESGGLPYLELEFVPGGSLDKHLDGTPWPALKAARLVEELARGVAEAHRSGVIHRDLKPSNVLLGLSGTPKVGDFGLARRLTVDSGLTRTEAILGSPSYMAPEQADGGARTAGPAADVYALGAILYELLTGRPPFRSASLLETLEQVRTVEPVAPSRLRKGLPRDLETVCTACLRKDPRTRYASADDLADDLGRFAQDRPVLARRTSLSERAWRRCRRNPVVSVLSACLAGLLIGIGVTVAAASLLRSERNEAVANLDRARRAERLTREEKSRADAASHLAQARAYRWSGRVGQRFRSLDELAAAAAVRPTLVLRNEAIACLALADARRERGWEVITPGTFAVVADDRLERFARGNASGSISILGASDGRELRLLPSPGGHAYFLRFSADGRTLHSLHHGNTLGRYWDLDTGKELSGPQMADLSRDGQFLAANGADGKVTLTHVGSGRVVGVFPSRPVWPTYAFDPARRRFAVVAPDSTTVRLYDLATGLEEHALAHPAFVHHVVWRPDGRLLATAANDNSLYVWDAQSGVRQAVLHGHEGLPTALAYSRRGDLLASSGWDATVRLWDPMSGRALVRLEGRLGVPWFGPDDRTLGFTQAGQKLELWRIESGGDVCRLLCGPQVPHPLWTVAFSPDGLSLAAAGPLGVTVWDRPSGRAATSLPGPCHSARFGGDGQTLLVCGARGVEQYPVPAARDGTEAPPGRPRLVFESPDVRAISRPVGGGRVVATDFARGRAVLLDPDGAAPPTVLGEHRGLAQVATSADGRWAATGVAGVSTPSVRVWDLRRKSLAWELPAPLSDGTACVAFSPDGRWLVTGTFRDYRLWEVGTWRAGPTIARENAGVMPGALAFAPDGSALAVSRSARHVSLVGVPGGEELASFEAPELLKIQALAFSPDGHRLAAACDRQTVQLWDLGVLHQALAGLGLDWAAAPTAVNPRASE